MLALTVCVEYDDLLAITLPQAAKHFERVCVVSTPGDERTAKVVAGVEGAEVFVTDAFYRRGAAFNKGLAIEEGLDAMGREGWLVIFDADIVMPAEMDFDGIQAGNLYCPRRRQLQQEWRYSEELDWMSLPGVRDVEHAGFFQLFHADDAALESRPWYGVDWLHAGGCDSDFQAKWPQDRKVWLPFDVLHLGPVCRNWHGRHTPRLDGRPIRDAELRCRRQAEMFARRPYSGYREEKLSAVSSQRSESDS